ncbi:MAG TPA: T9SS type A sorting domain-containing protein, partial [Chitinophagales bacterium]|nr:T9SS type A sorting domain-containing protein [Chitinophagales bacterium]
VRIIQEYTNQTAQAGYHYQVSFTDNNLDVIPGTYYLGIYYKNSTFDYSLINQNTFNNPVTFTVTGPANNIQMAGNTTLNPTAFTKGQAASVQAQIGNAGSGNWTGWISADLYKLDGTWVATFDEVQGSMNAQTAYNVTFNNSNLSVDPGSYLLAFFSTTNQQNYTLVYSQSFPNPVDVNVITPGLQPDQYEANNSEGASYGFNPSFNGNTASVQTTGSNMHIGSDYDYYTINLPSGTNYAITARVHDSNNSGNGQTYSNDVQFSYKVNGGSWSGTYDDVMGSQIGVQGGGTVTFFVADYFQGTVGSYLLDLQISRGANVGINEVSKDEISVYPNPASNKLFVNTTQNDGDYTLKIFNTTGAQVFEKNSAFNSNKIEVDISTLAQGIYNLQLQGKSGISNTKFTVK